MPTKYIWTGWHESAPELQLALAKVDSDLAPLIMRILSLDPALRPTAAAALRHPALAACSPAAAAVLSAPAVQIFVVIFYATASLLPLQLAVPFCVFLCCRPFLLAPAGPAGASSAFVILTLLPSAFCTVPICCSACTAWEAAASLLHTSQGSGCRLIRLDHTGAASKSEKCNRRLAAGGRYSCASCSLRSDAPGTI